MVPELGHYALILALVIALMQFIIPLTEVRKKPDALFFMRATVVGQFIFLSIAFFSLGYSFLINDFSVRYIAENSNTHLPYIYRFCALWGAHEGSLLLWVYILSIWTLLICLFNAGIPKRMLIIILMTLALLSIGFDLFLLTTSDPFLRLLPSVPLEGLDLNPILQDPGLAIHPPILYLGYVGFAIPFAFAIAGLVEKELVDIQWIRFWTLLAWCFLTFGIILGSWWAYRELGWGGWWFWDPVENASFLPWLMGTALLHALLLSAQRNIFKSWMVFLAIITFSLCLFGTFMVRSGILMSVHSFAVDPLRGLFMLNFLLIVISAALLLYASRARYLAHSQYFHFWSRESLLVANNLLLFVAMLSILLGTVYPLILDFFKLGKISVGAPYFNTIFLPLVLPLFLVMGLGPALSWRQPQYDYLPSLINLGLSILLGLILLSVYPDHRSSILGIFCAAWIILQTLGQVKLKNFWQNSWPMIFAHLGLATTILGVAITVASAQEKNVALKIMDSAQLKSYTFQLRNIQTMQKNNYQALQAEIAVYTSDRLVALLHPQLRNYFGDTGAIVKTAIDAGLFRDIYVAMGPPPVDQKKWEFRIYYKPMVRWIWLGGLLMILGGFLGAIKRAIKPISQVVQ